MGTRQITKQRESALIACVAAPLIVLAALSENIARHLHVSQASFLIADGAAALLLLLVVLSVRRRNQNS